MLKMNNFLKDKNRNQHKSELKKKEKKEKKWLPSRKMLGDQPCPSYI